MKLLAICTTIAISAGCGDPAPATPNVDAAVQPTGDAGDAGVPGADLVAARPYDLFVPTGLPASTPAPLIVLLHGYGASGELQATYFNLRTAAQDSGVLVALPDGLVDGIGRRFWNATDACCNFSGNPVDDVAYLTAVIDDVAARHAVDPARVYLVGHSNGGFMAHRMACDRSNRIAAIVSLAGATWNTAATCAPSEPVAVLQIHGDADTTIRYAGGAIGTTAYPSAATTVKTWADLNGCTGPLENTGVRLDLDLPKVGADTRVERFRDCPGAGADVELWTIEGGGHSPTFRHPAWSAALVGFLLAHPKP